MLKNSLLMIRTIPLWDSTYHLVFSSYVFCTYITILSTKSIYNLYGGLNVHMNELGVTRSIVETTIPLQQQSVSYYTESSITNYTGEPVYLMEPSGNIREIQPVAVGQTRGLLEINTITKTCNSLPYYNHTTGSYTKHPKTTIHISLQRLQSGPYYCREIGCSVSLLQHTAHMKSESLTDPEAVSKKVYEYSEKLFKENATVPLMVYANSYDEDIEYLYLEVNNKLVSVKVFHEYDQEECIVIRINRKENIREYVFSELNWKKLGYIERTIFDRKWKFGTDLERIEKAIRDGILYNKSLMTQEEFETELSLKVSQLNTTISEKDETINTLKKDLERTKKELQDTTYELTKANDQSKASYEQQILAMKLAHAQQEHIIVSDKREMTKEQFLRELEHERLKQEAERRVAEEKIRKEELSTRTAEINTLGVIFKTAAIIIPIAVSAGIWIASRMTTGTESIRGVISVMKSITDTIKDFGCKLWRMLFA